MLKASLIASHCVEALAAHDVRRKACNHHPLAYDASSSPHPLGKPLHGCRCWEHWQLWAPLPQALGMARVVLLGGREAGLGSPRGMAKVALVRGREPGLGSARLLPLHQRVSWPAVWGPPLLSPWPLLSLWPLVLLGPSVSFAWARPLHLHPQHPQASPCAFLVAFKCRWSSRARMAMLSCTALYPGFHKPKLCNCCLVS